MTGMLTLAIRNPARASSSRLVPQVLTRCRIVTPLARSISTSLVHRDLQAELERQLNPREIIEKKRKEFEDKYGDKLKKRAQAEGVPDLDALKVKVLAPSIKAALKSKRKAQEYKEQLQASMDVGARAAETGTVAKAPIRRENVEQGKGDRSGVKPLASIINLPLIHMTPHDANAISKIWTTYHATHPTLSSSYLSASLPASTYTSMLELARANPFFVLPLPRSAGDSAEAGQIKTDEYEMFYLQWLFHPTPTSGSPEGTALPPISSAIFTPLEEFRKAGEWAQPHLVLTHYPDLSDSHNVVLMRGEISPAAATGPMGSDQNPGFLLAQSQAQLLALALQRFYCADLAVSGESEQSRKDRIQRRDALKGFREKPEAWSWTGLVDMAYGGLV